MAHEPIIALDSPAGDAILDASALEVSAASSEVIPLVGMQFSGATGAACRACHPPLAGVDQFFEDHRIVAVGSGDPAQARSTEKRRTVCRYAAAFAALASRVDAS